MAAVSGIPKAGVVLQQEIKKKKKKKKKKFRIGLLSL